MIASGLSRLDGPTNMALDRSLLDAAEGEGIVGWRVYGWDGPWLTMGMNQDPAIDLLPTNPVPWVMRPTGGNAVLHGHDVTVGFAAPLGAIWPDEGTRGEGFWARSVRGAYRWATRPIVEALCACGLPCDLAENVAGVITAQLVSAALPNPESKIQNPRSADCFLGVSRNDVVDLRTGLKACGCAFRMTKRAVLLQASIPAGVPLVDPALIFAAPSTIVAPDWDAGRFPEAFEQALSPLNAQL